jgi:riboflavin kinase/FMN adenylyltransferase
MALSQLIRVDDVRATVQAVPCALVIGNFDGVHKGHQAVLERAVAKARAGETSESGGAQSLAPCVLTFDPHPAEVVGAGTLPLLTSLHARVALMVAKGIERVYVCRFDAAFAAWPPERFARELVAETLLARVVVVGANFRFGARRQGDLAQLRTMGGRLGFEVLVPDVACDDRGPYSSTRAREAITAGDLDEARMVLGRPHAVSGVVVPGSARGRTIGFPTANIEKINELLPRDGVYAVTVDREDEGEQIYRPLAWGITNIGERPTVGSGGRTVETHLLDASMQLYGAHLRLNFIARLRDEMRFRSLQELKEQIGQDAESARAILGGEGAPPDRARGNK